MAMTVNKTAESDKVVADGEKRQHLPTVSRSDFNPFANAKVASPFYRYNHDSLGDCSEPNGPGPVEAAAASGVSSRRESSVTTREDPEAQHMEQDLTPMVSDDTLEQKSSVEIAKMQIQRQTQSQSRWRWRLGGGNTPRPKQCLTKKRVSRWKSLPVWQRLLIKSLVVLLLTGLVVGVAVGVTLRVNGGVYKNNNQATNIH